jgi:uncharacterized protein (DUF362 family)
MILSASDNANLIEILDQVGMGVALRRSNSVLFKINLARPPEPGHPRTDPTLLTNVIRYCTNNGAFCAIAEGANGFLQRNLELAGLEKTVIENNVKVIDLDLEDFESVTIDEEEHYLPKCLKNYPLRIGMPALSKRPGMSFSNNVKLFVGAVPRRMYQMDEQTASTAAGRPRVHIDLHRSVANIYRAVMKYAPFGFFINGGKVIIDGQGELSMPETLIGDNALELDRHLLEHFNLQVPEYIERLVRSDSIISK